MFCSKCGNNIPDGSKFCPVCGANFAAQQQQAQPGQQQYQQQTQQQYQQYQQQYQAPNYQQAPQYQAAPEVDPKDHTADFDEKDVSENKIYAMGCYLFSVLGIIIALLASKDSEYIKFHVRQAMKFTVAYALLSIAAAVLCWTVIVPIAAVVGYCILLVLQIIAFFQICKGKSKEPAILYKWKFLD